MENTLRALFIDYKADWNQQDFNNAFKAQLKYELLELMSDDTAPNSVSISTMTCMGNIPSNPYLVKGIFGCQDCSFWF